MKIKTSHLLLIFVFLFTLAFRLYLVFSVSNFSDDGAYFHLRHIESITHDKKLIYYDDLSYGGRPILQPPLFHLLMAILSFGNLFMLKFLPELFLSLMVFVVYVIAKEMSGNEHSAIFASLLSGFIPTFLEKTLNVISVYSLSLPILLFMFYSLLKLDEKFYRNAFIACSFLLPLIHPIALLFVIAVFFYFLIIGGGAVSATKIKKEAILFSVLAVVLIEFIIYKKALLTYGLGTVWQNIPLNILEDTYKKFSFRDLILGVGMVPLIFGSIGIYIGMNEKKKSIYLYSGFTLSILLLLVLRLISIATGLMILGISLSIFSSIAFAKFNEYLKRTRFHSTKYLFACSLLASFALFSFIPSFGDGRIEHISSEKLDDMKWLKDNTNEGDVIVGNVLEGHFISSIAGRKNIVDTNFLLAPNPLRRLRDVNTIYTSFTEAKAFEIIRRYNVKVIYLSEDTEKMYGVNDLNFVRGTQCFDWRSKFYVFKC